MMALRSLIGSSTGDRQCCERGTHGLHKLACATSNLPTTVLLPFHSALPIVSFIFLILRHTQQALHAAHTSPAAHHEC